MTLPVRFTVDSIVVNTVVIDRDFRCLNEAGLKTLLHANGTNIEGEWDTVFAAIKRCHKVVHEMGAPRIFTVIEFGTRTDLNQSMDEKIRSVEGKLSHP